MIYVSEVFTTEPAEFKTALHKKTYAALRELNIPFERVDNDDAITMEDCLRINEVLNVKVCKTLFLCNRQQTAFYLFVTAGDKPFVTKDFSRALGISRVSFAPPELLEKLCGTRVGATTVFSTLLDPDNNIQVVIDRDVLKDEWYGCTDGTTTCYMRVRTEHILNVFLPYTKHEPLIIEV